MASRFSSDPDDLNSRGSWLHDSRADRDSLREPGTTRRYTTDDYLEALALRFPVRPAPSTGEGGEA